MIRANQDQCGPGNDLGGSVRCIYIIHNSTHELYKCVLLPILVYALQTGYGQCIYCKLKTTYPQGVRPSRGV